MIWNKTFGGINYDIAYSAQQTSDGGYIITGYTYSYGNVSKYLWLIKVNSDGKELWNNTYAGRSGLSVQQTFDDCFIVTGYDFISGGSQEALLLKTDKDGNELWNKMFGGPSNDVGFSLKETCDGSYVIAGYTYSYGYGSSDLWLIKTKSDGIELWNITFGGTGNDNGYSVHLTSDHGYILSDGTSSYGNGLHDMWLIRVESDNHRPKLPNRPIGPTDGHIEKKYTYSANTTDSDKDEIYYMWDWGDGNFSDWIGPFKSGETVNVSYKWINPGLYQIRVKARDKFHYESDWSDALAVIISQRPLDLVLLFGFVSNLISEAEFYIFNAEQVLWINFNPFEPIIFTSADKILISRDYVGVILLPFGFVIGFFNAAVL
jgi:hypothetical protein